MSSELIPNSFQTPNLYADRLAYFLTPPEQVVLTKATREILGFHNKIVSRKARIALSVFVDGKHNTDGKRLCYGCGIGRSAVRRALEKLDEYGILVKTGAPTVNGQEFSLQDDADGINWHGLEKRRGEWDKANKERTDKAVAARHPADEEVVSDTRGNVQQTNSGMSDIPQGVCPTYTKKPSRNPVETHTTLNGVSAEKTAIPPNVEKTVGLAANGYPIRAEDFFPFKTPGPRRAQQTEIDRYASISGAMEKYQNKHALGGTSPIAEEWRGIPTHQGVILTEFFRLSGMAGPVTKSRRNSATHAAEVLYKEVGSSSEVVKRLQFFFSERAKGEKYQFEIVSLYSLVNTLCAMTAVADGPKVIRVGG